MSRYLEDVVGSLLPASGPNPEAQTRLKKWVTAATFIIFSFMSALWISLGWTKPSGGLRRSVRVEGFVRRGFNTDLQQTEEAELLLIPN